MREGIGRGRPRKDRQNNDTHRARPSQRSSGCSTSLLACSRTVVYLWRAQADYRTITIASVISPRSGRAARTAPSRPASRPTALTTTTTPSAQRAVFGQRSADSGDSEARGRAVADGAPTEQQHRYTRRARAGQPGIAGASETQAAAVGAHGAVQQWARGRQRLARAPEHE